MPDRSAPAYDVCIVGSGAAGGIAAHVLTRGGLRVALLEAGPALDPERDFKQHVWPYEVPDRGLDIKGTGETLMANGSWRIDGEPYLNARGTDFRWFRSRIVGGRTNHWGRGVARFSPEDFGTQSRDDADANANDDWPLTYEELAPYYDKVEDYVGVVGPTSHDGRQASGMPTLPAKCTERVVRRGCDALGIPCVPTATALVTRPHRGRPACHYCAQCWRGCKSGSAFSIGQTAVPDAMRTGRLTLLTNAMAREILTDARGLASEVSYVDKDQGQEKRVRASCVIVAASACESARLLLNSRGPRHRTGLANSSGVVGRFLRDSVGARATAYFAALEGRPRHNCDGIGRPHIMVPWWRPRDVSFSKGYEILFPGGFEMPLMGIFNDVADDVEGYGVSLKETCRRRYGAFVEFIMTGEMRSNAESFCEVDDGTLDVWGIPVLRFHFAWGEEERAMAAHMVRSARAIIEAAGGVCTTPDGTAAPVQLMPPGSNFHEAGTVRMGRDPETSALNAFGQAHDVPNLFVLDAGCFVTSPEKPPTLTIMALAWRASEYLLDRAGRGLDRHPVPRS